MGFATAIWDLDDDPEGNVQHIAERGLTKDEVDEGTVYPVTAYEVQS